MLSFKKSTWLSLIAGTAFLLMPAVLAPTSVQAQAKKGGTLIYVHANGPRHLNGAVQSGSVTAIPGTQIFASPLRFDANWQPQPYLAESWKMSDDQLSLTLNLRKNAKFHDGKPITSADVAFSLMTVKKNHPFKTMFAAVSKVDTPDAHTAIIRLSRKHPAIILAMSPALLPILPKHIYDDGTDIKKHPHNLKPFVGSGPFKFVEMKKGRHIILERNPDYFLPNRPYLDKIIIKIQRNRSSIVLGLKKGDFHLHSFASNTRQIMQLSADKSLTVTSKGYEGIGPVAWLSFNFKNEQLKHKKVRQAIAYAIDRKFITNSLFSGLAKLASGPIAAGHPLAGKNLNLYDVDIAKANKMLDEAGFPRKEDGFRFKLRVDSTNSARNVSEYLKPQLKKIGVDIILRISPDFSTWLARIKSHDFDLNLETLFNWGDPIIGVHRSYLTSNIRKGIAWSNTGSYSNPVVDKLLAKAGQETDDAKRKAIYAEF